jgi:eukaryotic-like serine/threonine-protein kinase
MMQSEVLPMAVDPRVRALFNSALDLPAPTERSAYLDRECGDDTELRRRVNELLAAFDQPARKLEHSLTAAVASGDDAGQFAAGFEPPDRSVDRTASLTSQEEPIASLIGSVIAGRYKIRQEIGEGGMGSVYLAEQSRPIRRMVALKLIKPGMDSRAVLARFESERQALALMDHPNIAKVLDAGATEAGHPYFVMELVKGIPVTEYCDQHRLGVPERLALVRQICSAVQHAHQKGIIHRDLKPSNILVESHDDTPVPKVIDFGLAKATSGHRLTEQSLFTAFGSVAGTPLYMAPEQARFNAIDVDTRADIYSLGVILYELLTGSTPIRREMMQKAALDEILRVIREDEPPAPSSRLSTSDALSTLAASRHMEPTHLSRFVRGDLDRIVMKALAKERQRRYDSAIGLANDIERFINHEPVSAGPPSAAYRLRKFVRRNRGGVIAASGVLLALIGGIIGTTLGILEANKQSGLARAQRELALAGQKQAEERLAQRDKANEILLSIFHDVNHDDSVNETLPLANRLGKQLDAAAAQLEGDAVDDPLGVARMQSALGAAMQSLGHSKQAITILTEAVKTQTERLGPDHMYTLQSMVRLASAHEGAGEFDSSVTLLEKILVLSKKNYGPDAHDTILTMSNLASGLERAGRYDESLALFERTLDLATRVLGPNQRSTLTLMNNYGVCCREAGQHERSLEIFERLNAIRKSTLGPDHLATIATMNNLALAYRFTGQQQRALPLHEEVLSRSRRKFGLDHPVTLTRMGNLAEIYRQTGRVDQSVPLFEETNALMKASLGLDHPSTLISQRDVARVYQDLGRLDEAHVLIKDAAERANSALGRKHRDTLNALCDLADSYLGLGRLDEALEVARGLPDLDYYKTGRPSVERAYAESVLGRIQLARKAWPEAEAPLRNALAFREISIPNDWTTFNTRSLLGAALLGQKKYADAEPLLRAGYEGVKSRAETLSPANKHNLRDALDRLIELAQATGKADQAKAWKEERAKMDAHAASKPVVKQN